MRPITQGNSKDQPAYIQLEIPSHAPSFTAKVATIFGLTLALQFVLFSSSVLVLRDDHPALAWAKLVLVAALVPTGIVARIDNPKSVWAARWANVVLVLCLAVVALDVVYLFQQR